MGLTNQGFISSILQMLWQQHKKQPPRTHVCESTDFLQCKYVASDKILSQQTFM